MQLLRLRKPNYPGQFWLMFWGMLISTVGSSMVWPFLMIYITERLSLPLTTATAMMSLNAAMGLIASFVAGPVVDRLGRKGVLVFALLGNGLVYFFYSQANSLPLVALLMALSGIFSPLYRVGSDAMVADLIPQDDRPNAYALLRMANNLGIAVGPALGGFAASISYAIAFNAAAVGMSAYAFLQIFFARETLPSHAAPSGEDATAAPVSLKRLWNTGYRQVLADRPFIFFIGAFILATMCTNLIWVLLPVHAKSNYGVIESQYGWLPTTNAVMVVVFQVIVTRFTKRRQPLLVMACGAFFYALAVASVALGQGFWGFWVSMVIMTTGELMLVPTASTYTANQAPAHMRGRYMSFQGLVWPVASGIGPLLGGVLNDQIGPSAPWLGMGFIGLISVSVFIVLAVQERRRARPAGLSAVN